MSNPLLCKDCLHFQMVGEMEYAASHKCGKLRTKAFIDPVIGNTEPSRPISCWAARREGKRCGPEGKLFTPNYAAAQAIEARSTETTPTEGNSPVPQECAQPHSENNHD